jgi:hypothetical protein
MKYISAFLPLLIFLSLWFGIGIYYARKVEKHKKNIKADSSRPSDHLTLIRGIEQTNYIRKYKVIIDNKSAGYIASGETKHILLNEGSHKIQVKVDWCTSKPFEVFLKKGENIPLVCGASFNNWHCLYKWALSPSSWVYVRKA